MKTRNYNLLLAIVLALFAVSFSSYAQNVATSGTVSASSEDMAVGNAIDGNDGTRWASVAADPQWLAVTLDDTYSIDKIKIHWEAANAADYSIKVSTDSTNWTQVYTTTGEAFGDRWDVIDFTATNVKYIVMDGTARSSQWGYSIWEFEVYEEVSEAQDATLSDLKVDGVSIDGFSADIIEYDYFVSSTTVPAVTATATVNGAGTEITAAASIPGATTVEVTATDNNTTQIYTVNFREPIEFPIGFEKNSTYQWGEFGAPATVIANPQSSGINTSANVAQIVKNPGADWAGSFITIDNPIDLSSETRVSAKFYSPRSGINMMMKLETSSGYATAEIQTPTTVANEWEVLTFDFDGTDVSKEFIKIVIICDRQTVGDGTAAHTYLVDDIKLFEAAPDSEDPTSFTATLGDVTHNSVEFLLNATDNSGSLTYSIVYGEDSVTTNGSSAVEKAYVLEGLDAETAYSFSVRAFDAAGNVASNNPIALNTTTEATPDVSYCQESTKHLNIEAETASEIYLTIEKIDATSMYVQVESATEDPVDLLLVNGSGATSNVLDDTTPGIYKRTLTFESTPVDVSFEILWSKETTPGNWMLNTFTVPFDMTCDPGTPTRLSSVEATMTIYPNPADNILNFTKDVEQVEIYEIAGRLAAKANISAQSYDVSGLEPGSYFIRLKDSEANVSTLRFIKK